MSLAATQRPTRLAPWALRVVLLALQLILAAAVLHRMAAFSTAVAVNLMLIGFAGCLLAALLALAAMVQVWRRGGAGAGNAASALVIGALALTAPAYYLPAALGDASVSDVATDPKNPPAFIALAKPRLAAGAAVDAATLQPAPAELELEPLLLDRSPSDVFDLANDVMRQLDLNIIAEEAPGFGSEAGSIEATERTLILGLTDDIAIRIVPEGVRTRVDIRSAARYQRLDFGRNGERVKIIARRLQSGVDSSVPSDPALAADAEQAVQPAVKPAGTSGAGTAVRRKKRAPAQRGVQGAPGLTASQR
jgi:uncharacterized protein (DUF1499 family)